MQPRRARRTDANQSEIVDYLRRRWGASVETINGAFDILVSWGGPSWPCEIKDGSKSPSRRRLTEREQKFAASYKGRIIILESLADADAFAVAAIRIRDANWCDGWTGGVTWKQLSGW